MLRRDGDITDSNFQNIVTVASRTPEGFPARCPLCGAATNLEFSEPSGDAPCPNCGHLLWFSAEMLEVIQRQMGDAAGRITADSTFAELGVDSLDSVELVMELEEELNLSISDEISETFQNIGDVIRFIEQHRRKHEE